MSKKLKKLIVMCLMLTLLLVPTQVLAIDNMDLTKPVNFTVSTDNKAMAGMELGIYKVAETNEWAEFTLTGAFAGYNVEVNDLDSEGWKTLAETLSSYVDRDNIIPQASGKVNSNGSLPFGQQSAGLYLVYGTEYTSGETIYTPTPFMICLPNRAEGSEVWNYDVQSQLKYASRMVEKEKMQLSVRKVWDDAGKEDSRPDYITVSLLKDGEAFGKVKLSASNDWSYTWTEMEANCQYKVAEVDVDGYKVSISREKNNFTITNSINGGNGGEKLPQTGVLWWPVPVLIVAGLLFIIIGLTRRKGSESEN